MEEDNSEPVRFRATLEWTFPDADPWDARSYGTLLDAVKQALESAPAVNCKDVIIREAMRVGPNDDINAARGIQTKFDWSLLSPHCGHVLGTVYPVPPVNPDELEKVWELTSKAERGELKNSNILIAIGQALKPQSDAPATVARAYILTALQKAHAFREPPSPEIFERAATIPIERPVQNESEFLTLARQFKL